jgi:hypothetical protein
MIVDARGSVVCATRYAKVNAIIDLKPPPLGIHDLRMQKERRCRKQRIIRS